VAEKTSALEAEAFKTKRMQEETAILKRKVSPLTTIFVRFLEVSFSLIGLSLP
jgi:hypothetical protein